MEVVTMSQPTTEELLADARRLYGSLIDATTRLAAFTEMLRAMLAALPPEEDEESSDER
jgi:hypothetical protein